MANSSSTLDRVRPVTFAALLAKHGARPALLTATDEISYAQLADLVESTADRLGSTRRLVLVVGNNSVDAVVTYLAALAAGHPVLLVPGGPDTDQLVATYRPDVVAGPGDGGWRLHELRAATAHDLHPDLALLLSTSGSTGSPKLVRLSHDNLESNAEAIATYLDIRADDRAATTLPMSYCYGLSVVNSHLQRGAGLILTDRSVADPGFWQLFRDRAGTSLAGVPYTFDLLDRVGFAEMALPHLRTITQAGGRLDPAQVARYAALGRRDGWRLFVMYGQTEATARMAYLPPDLAETRPFAIGRPIPGGRFRLEPVGEPARPDTGELVYSGPNVMLGYAEGPADLALGRTVHELRTGDLARRCPDGIYEIVGRRSRFAKIRGLRVDPHRVEATLAEHGITALCVGRDDELVVGVADGDARRIRRLLAQRCGLPVRAVSVHALPELPRLANGKPDYAAVGALSGPPAPPPAPPADPRADPQGLVALYAQVLDRIDATEESSFVGLGGDSLSYVEMSIRLEQALGTLPADWPTRAIRDLAPPPERLRRRWAARLDTSVALRAIAIVLIVGTHAQLFAVSGGAHLLLGVAGFNLARFHLTDAPRAQRVRGLLRSLGRIVAVSVAWIGLVYLLTDDYALRHVFLLHYVIGPPGQHNHYWFIEAFVTVSLAVCALMALPSIDRLERRYPFAVPLGLAALGLVARYQLIPGAQLRTPAVVFWLVALGWATARAATVAQRAIVTTAVVATVPGFFGSPAREAVVVAGMVLLIWAPTLPSLRLFNRVAGVLAGASLYIYLTHWQVFPHLDQVSAVLALLASLVTGIAVGELIRRAPRRLRVGARRTAAVG